ncbi:MAG: 1-acyl-sn-glycerol-3-phosphate acyltransferase [Bacteroidia bacterium]|nr:1-acyl-sn-glycerol-3-phosphate acyltransferase [Bacteroidia bacterium]NND10332.1 1-acyl-sn-glycerol-3-phosphate acyltransferase [Flavobacteriaceae bacterium]NNK28079.1 1-acyl-sn-glycerol-3-phosphate acyltransferase [Flavobacteriaceae bacterium]
MAKLLAYPLSILYFIFFGLSLLVFHPIQWFCLNVFGYQAHKKSVDILNWFLVRSTHFLGTRYSFRNPYSIPTDKPIIIVSNHQSMNDIPPIIWFMRKHHAKFISKKELGKGIPSVSFNLRHGGSVLIDRKDPVQSINAIKQIAGYIETHNRAVVIFPEGSRSRDGNPKPFKKRGLETLFKHTPNAFLVPITINNSWKLLRYGKFPYGIGTHITFEVHQPIPVSDNEITDLLIKVENTIKQAII